MTYDSIAIDILAQTDGIWSPQRRFEGSEAGTRACLQQRYPESGIPFRPRSADPTEQKADQREIDALAESGLVRVFQTSATRLNAIRLTDEGEAEARRLCGLPCLRETLDCLAAVAELIDAGAAVECRGMTLVSESTLTRTQYATPGAADRFAMLAECLHTALARGWARAHSTTRGHVAYVLTDAGREALATVKAPYVEGPHDRRATEAYDRAYLKAMAKIRAMRVPDSGEVGPCPIPPFTIPAPPRGWRTQKRRAAKV